MTYDLADIRRKLEMGADIGHETLKAAFLQVEADAAAMRRSVENFALSFTGFNFNCTICGAHGKAQSDLKHDDHCALSRTAGRDLLARMERMREALTSIGQHCAMRSSALAKAIVTTCEAAIADKEPTP